MSLETDRKPQTFSSFVIFRSGPSGETKEVEGSRRASRRHAGLPRRQTSRVGGAATSAAPGVEGAGPTRSGRFKVVGGELARGPCSWWSRPRLPKSSRIDDARSLSEDPLRVPGP